MTGTVANPCELNEMASLAVVEAGEMADIEVLIKAQIAAVDNMLLNAWGTVYKMAVKYLDYNILSYELSHTEELLSAKNLVANLWSVLEYCCIILCYRYHGIPSPARARKIHFPCDYHKLPRSPQLVEDEVVEWEKKQLKPIAELPLEVYNKEFQGAFSDVQFKGRADSSTRAFYWLHFLRNTLVHQSINITAEDKDRHRPIIFEVHNIDRNAQAAITVELPVKPWEKNSTDKEPVPLLDVLYQACEVVQNRRDKLMGVIGEEKFMNKFDFDFSEKVLEILFRQVATRCPIRCNQLHLECYGMEADLKEPLKKLRSHEYLYPACVTD